MKNLRRFFPRYLEMVSTLLDLTSVRSKGDLDFYFTF